MRLGPPFQRGLVPQPLPPACSPPWLISWVSFCLPRMFLSMVSEGLSCPPGHFCGASGLVAPPAPAPPATSVWQEPPPQPQQVWSPLGAGEPCTTQRPEVGALMVWHRWAVGGLRMEGTYVRGAGVRWLRCAVVWLPCPLTVTPAASQPTSVSLRPAESTTGLPGGGQRRRVLGGGGCSQWTLKWCPMGHPEAELIVGIGFLG